jgi:Leu/Phe-tRNA-protein transferase
MVKPKKGEIWINTGFWEIYKKSRHVAYVRIVEVRENEVAVYSLADTPEGQLSCGKSIFTVENKEWHPKFQKATSEQLKSFFKSRQTWRILYASGRGYNLT